MYSGKLVPIAFPDTYVRYSENFIQENFFPLVGLGKKGYIKAGHAALLLIENATGNIYYYDFGRYITPPKHGRVRSVLTDVELEIPFKATIENNKVVNIEEVLLWLASHPEKTHGEGRLIASVCNEINFEKAETYLKSLQQKGSIPYKAFGNTGSNCSRLVTDTLIKASNSVKVTLPLKRNNLFTPSPLGNVKYGANGGDIFMVENNVCSVIKNSMRKEIMFNYFDHSSNKNGAFKDNFKTINENLHYLGGIGASAFFEILAHEENFIIKRYTNNLKLDFEGVFKATQKGFNLTEAYKFVYDSNCLYCHIEQKNVKYRFDLLRKIS